MGRRYRSITDRVCRIVVGAHDTGAVASRVAAVSPITPAPVTVTWPVGSWLIGRRCSCRSSRDCLLGRSRRTAAAVVVLGQWGELCRAGGRRAGVDCGGVGGHEINRRRAGRTVGERVPWAVRRSEHDPAACWPQELRVQTPYARRVADRATDAAAKSHPRTSSGSATTQRPRVDRSVRRRCRAPALRGALPWRRARLLEG